MAERGERAGRSLCEFFTRKLETFYISLGERRDDDRKVLIVLTFESPWAYGQPYGVTYRQTGRTKSFMPMAESDYLCSRGRPITAFYSDQ